MVEETFSFESHSLRNFLNLTILRHVCATMNSEQDIIFKCIVVLF